MVRSAGSQARHYALAETEKEDELEVLSIDVTEGVVKAHHRGVEILLSFASQVKQEAATRIAEQNVDRDHVRAHEIREAKERERIDRERAAVETELAFFVKAP